MSLVSLAGIAGSPLPALGGHVARMLEVQSDHAAARGTVSESTEAAFGAVGEASSPGSGPAVFRCEVTGCLVSADSRLDNGRALRRELELADSSERATGDADLILAAYERWGDGMATRLRGDFAFAIWDPRRRRLFAARDIFGVRPLAYCVGHDGWFAFASDVDALLSWHAVPAEFNRGRLADALIPLLEGVYEDATFYAAISRLPPACALNFAEGQVQIRRYWLPSEHPPEWLPGSVDEWADAVRGSLRQAVARRILGQGRVGCMLSGGVDSSSIVALASEILESADAPALPTFSATHSSQIARCPETTAIRAMQAAFPAAAVDFDVASQGEVAEALRAHLPRLAEPFDGGSLLIVAQYLLASRAGMQVLCDGIAGDNLFSDDGLVQRLVRERRWAQVVALMRDRIAVFGGHPRNYGGILRHSVGSFVPSGIRRLKRRWQSKNPHLSEIEGSLVTPELAIEIDASQRIRDQFDHHTRLRPADSSANRCGYSMVTPWLTQGIDRYRRSGARFGVEPSHPFLDRDLIELCTWLPLELRTSGGWNKWMLRQSMSTSLPAEVAWRPGGQHLGWKLRQTVLGPLIAERLGDGAVHRRLQGIVDTGRMQRDLVRWLAGDSRHFQNLSACVLLDCWLGVRECSGRPRLAPSRGLSGR